jgi:hypothetical protein
VVSKNAEFGIITVKIKTKNSSSENFSEKYVDLVMVYLPSPRMADLSDPRHG